MGAVKERKDVLDTVRERINELRAEYMGYDDDDVKISGKRQPSGSLEELEAEARAEDEEESEEVEEDEENEEEGGDMENEEEESENEEIDPKLVMYFNESDAEEEDKGEKEGEKPKVKRDHKLKEKVKKGDDGSSSESSEENDQGFVDAVDIDTFRKPKRERQAEEAKLGKEKFKKNVKEKKGSTTNTAKNKNKPYMMVLPKKQKEMLRAKYKSIKERIRDLEKKKQKVRKGKIMVKRKIYVKS